MRVIWSEKSVARLDEIKAYISTDSPITADRVIRKLISSVVRLELFPLSGRMIPEYEDSSLREIITPPYRILYSLKDDRVEIINVIHSRQQLL